MVDYQMQTMQLQAYMQQSKSGKSHKPYWQLENYHLHEKIVDIHLSRKWEKVEKRLQFVLEVCNQQANLESKSEYRKNKTTWNIGGFEIV